MSVRTPIFGSGLRSDNAPALSTRVERVASRRTRRESRLSSDQFHAFNPRRSVLGIVDRTTVEIRLADTSTGR
jgi:hypothetical protein